VKSQLNNSDVAQALIVAMKHNLLGHDSVRKWADHLIEFGDTPSPWMLELSFCTANDAAYNLNRVPGGKCKRNIYSILFGMAYDAHHAGAIDVFELRDVGWAAYIDDPDSIPDHWGLKLELAIEAHSEGYATIDDVDSTVADVLVQLKPFADSLPKQLRRGITNG